MTRQVRKSAESYDAYKDAELIKQHYRRTPHAKKLFIALPKLPSTIFADGSVVHERRDGSGTSSRQRLLRKVNNYPMDDDNENDPEIFSSVSSSDDDLNEVKKAKSSNIWNQLRLDEHLEPEMGQTALSSSYQSRGTQNPRARHQESGRIHRLEVSTRTKVSSLDSKKTTSSDPVYIADGLPFCIPMNMISWFQPPWY